MNSAAVSIAVYARYLRSAVMKNLPCAETGLLPTHLVLFYINAAPAGGAHGAFNPIAIGGLHEGPAICAALPVAGRVLIGGGLLRCLGGMRRLNSSKQHRHRAACRRGIFQQAAARKPRSVFFQGRLLQIAAAVLNRRRKSYKFHKPLLTDP